jgi:hypothetical protein
MTETREFGRLEAVPLRDAFLHEARDLTPWLAANLDRLGEALRMPALELVNTEVKVNGFSADILARNPGDDSQVLIENQLEGSDHNHLGQIMTYLGGLKAKTVVWVASGFNDAHLAAIRWLNENTSEAFSFFAVEIQTVRIGNSQIAPVFDVVERPNAWIKSVAAKANEANDRSALGEFRAAFWTHFLARCPSETPYGPANSIATRWRTPTADGLVVVQFVARDRVGVFIRGTRGVSDADTEMRLEPIRERLEQVFAVSLNSGDYLFIKRLRLDALQRANWDQMSDWLHAQADLYVATLQDASGVSR